MKHIKQINELFGYGETWGNIKPMEDDDIVETIIEIIKQDEPTIEYEKGYKFTIELVGEGFTDFHDIFIESNNAYTIVYIDGVDVSANKKLLKEMYDVVSDLRVKQSMAKKGDVKDKFRKNMKNKK